MAHGMVGSTHATNLRYERYAQTKDETDRLIECYQSVFADPPWNEWRKCTECGASWGNRDQALLQRMNFRHCGVTVEPYWPTDVVRSDLAHEIGPRSSCWLAYSSRQVVGFCWGYPIAAKALEEKLGIGITTAMSRLGLTTGKIAYQDELGVLMSYRGQKIAKELFAKRHEDFLKQGLTVGMVRTREGPEPSVTYEWFTKKFGYEVVAHYPDGDGRVVLAQRLSVVTQILAK